jgi:hypothetical protein
VKKEQRSILLRNAESKLILFCWATSSAFLLLEEQEEPQVYNFRPVVKKNGIL